jgi:hypothetical protein
MNRSVEKMHDLKVRQADGIFAMTDPQLLHIRMPSDGA